MSLILERMLVRNGKLRVKAGPECDVIDITPEVRRFVIESGIRDGTVTLFNVGSTAGLTTVEFEPGCVQDLKDLFQKIAPATRDYHHEQTWHDGNGFSHMRASLLRPSLVVPVAEGQMRLGTWQQIVLLNFDNKVRTREVAIQTMGIG